MRFSRARLTDVLRRHSAPGRHGRLARGGTTIPLRSISPGRFGTGRPRPTRRTACAGCGAWRRTPPGAPAGSGDLVGELGGVSVAEVARPPAQEAIDVPQDEFDRSRNRARAVSSGMRSRAMRHRLPRGPVGERSSGHFAADRAVGPVEGIGSVDAMPAPPARSLGRSGGRLDVLGRPPVCLRAEGDAAVRAIRPNCVLTCGRATAARSTHRCPSSSRYSARVAVSGSRPSCTSRRLRRRS